MLDQADASTTSSLELGELPSSLRGNRDTELANRQRGLLKYYFKSAGAVALQDKMVYRQHFVVLLQESKDCLRNH